MSCTDVQTIQPGDGSKVNFSFDFPYIFKSEIHVYFWNVTTKEWDEKLTTDATHPWRVTDANPTIVEFTSTAPPAPTAPTDPGEPTVDNVRIRRITNIDDIRALFNPGSAIRSDDLNRNFEQLRYAIQEANCVGIPDDVDEYLKTYYWNKFDDVIYSADDWPTDNTADQKIATVAAMDARFQDAETETVESGEEWVSDDDHIATTAAIDARFFEDEDETIKSNEAWTNSDDLIATTSAIDARIDAAITGDIASDGSGITVTDDGDGTITLSIEDGDLGLEKIDPADIIIRDEQDAAEAPADSKVFTSLAAARRFDTLVQTDDPGTAIAWETGKGWLQNDADLTLSIWTGSGWTPVASGGSFTSQTKVVYVDAENGNDAKDGHRISTPKDTIKSAIEQINTDLFTTITSGGASYVDGTYTNVTLTGGSGTGLQADLVVAGGVVTTVTLKNNRTLANVWDYQAGDVLSANNADLGGTGAGLQITLSTSDGSVVAVAAGVYQEVAPIQIRRKNISIVGQSLRSCIVHPTQATETNTLFELNSGSYVAELTLTGVKASGARGAAGSLYTDATHGLPPTQGWNFAFLSGATITKSPYIQNCTNFSDSGINNNDLNINNPAGGFAGDTTSAVTGGGMLIDGSTVAADSPLRSIVADSYTHVGLNGPGIFVTNNGYAQITSSYAFFNHFHIACLNGGQANLAASTTDFGTFSLIADGQSPNAIFTSNVDGAVVRNVDNDPPIISFNINEPTAGTNLYGNNEAWFGSTTRPQDNMLVSVNGVTYPVLSAVSNIDSEGGNGWTVTISRPDPNDTAVNIGLATDLADDAAVSFFLRSMIASSGHTMEYVGSGTDYDALPENGGVPNENNQVVELNDGKIWSAITDHRGTFKLGDFFTVNQSTGTLSVNNGSFQVNLETLDVNNDGNAVFGAPLDMGDNQITSSAGDLKLNATGDINVQTNKITNVVDPTADQDAATKKYVDDNSINNVVEDTTPQLGGDLDVQGSSITTSTADGPINLDPGGNGGVVILGNEDDDGADPPNPRDNTGKLVLNCEKNTHGVTVQAPLHADILGDAGSYSLTLPTGVPDVSGKALISTTGGVMSWGFAGGAMGGSNDQVFFENDQTVTTSYTITSNKNAMSAGPITINSGVVVTVPSGSTWVIV